MLLKSLTIVLLLAAVAVVADPTPPVYPAQFTVPIRQFIFSEGKSYPSQFVYYYDATKKLTTQAHGEGQMDFLCHSIAGKENSTEPCTQVVASDTYRYVVFPRSGECCQCCNATMGCGIMNQNWLSTGTYQGNLTYHDVVCDGWLVMGNDPNYYYATADKDQKPCMYYEGTPTIADGVNLWEYDTAEYVETVSDPSVFYVSPSCTTPCKSDFCTAFRTSGVGKFRPFFKCNRYRKF